MPADFAQRPRTTFVAKPFTPGRLIGAAHWWCNAQALLRQPAKPD
ncbi:MAG TPA: hypothetical protein VHX44_11275 [Planctomycetota bacterium]|nr:hypothetical protein [Planctomycetota bacterium]